MYLNVLRFYLAIFFLITISHSLKGVSADISNSQIFFYPEYSEAEHDKAEVVRPCNVIRPGDPDLTTYDIISSYRFDEYHKDFQGVQLIAGSSAYQTAYRIEAYANTTIDAEQAFPKGVPVEFSFECTFRVLNRHPLNEWLLFELTDTQSLPQMSLLIDPVYKTIEFSLPKYGSLQTAAFEGIEIFDNSWHKVMLSVKQNTVSLWIDCSKVPASSGSLDATLNVRGPMNANGGSFVVAHNPTTQKTVPIDLQWMIFSCDTGKPTRTDCGEIKDGAAHPYRVKTRLDIKSPKVDTFPTPASTPAAPLLLQALTVCPDQCPPGPPGLPGIAGPPGLPGAQILQKSEKGEPGLSGLPGRDGLKGEPGVPGLPGRNGNDGLPGMPGRPGPPGPAIHEVPLVSNFAGRPGLPGVKGDAGLPGPPGVPGISGPPGSKGSMGLPGKTGLPGVRGETGYRGEKGEPGNDGINGYPGAVGPMGPQGPSGPPGMPAPTGNAGTITGEFKAINEGTIRDICMEVVREYISEMSVTLTGPPGPPGRPGVGKSGPAGLPGIQGEKGERGSQGVRGYPGIPGMPGIQGNMGPRGFEGQKGEKGCEGIGREGPIGPPGPQGSDGRSMNGLPARQGERGIDGVPGVPGPVGAPGQPGICPDCMAYEASYTSLIQRQQNNKGPSNY